MIRRFVGTQLFVYLLGRAFFGTALCVFAAGALSLVARWLMAGGDAFVTGMLAVTFVAFEPDWRATWSDPLNLEHRGS